MGNLILKADFEKACEIPLKNYSFPKKVRIKEIKEMWEEEEHLLYSFTNFKFLGHVAVRNWFFDIRYHNKQKYNYIMKNQLKKIIKKLIVEKKNFIKNKIGINIYIYNKEVFIYMTIKESLLSYLKQKYDGWEDYTCFGSSYYSWSNLDYLFSETEENKKLKKQEMEELYNKCLKWYS